MPRSPHPSVAGEENNSNSIQQMETFPALKVYHCQFCPELFLTESARRTHNNMEFRDFAKAHARMDSVGGASGQAGGARDVVVVIAILKEAITFQIAEFVMNVLIHTSFQREMYGCKMNRQI